MRPGIGRFRRAVLAALVTAAVAVPVSGTALAAVPAPAPARLGAVSAATLGSRYAANRGDIAEAARMAEAYGDDGRAAQLRAMAGPRRRFLVFDGHGAGRAVEVIGDLAGAERVAVVVPGSDTELDTYQRFHADADALYDEVHRQDPKARVAVVAWLGYPTPATVSPEVLTPGRARQAAPGLRTFVATVRSVDPGAGIALVCHSYGSVVCGQAAAGLPVTDIALVGSPGTGAATARELDARGRIWAGRGASDWIADVPHARVDLFGTTVGFGADPVSPGFGARVFAAGGGSHSGYFRPGSVSLRNLARIALGHDERVTHG